MIFFRRNNNFQHFMLFFFHVQVQNISMKTSKWKTNAHGSFSKALWRCFSKHLQAFLLIFFKTLVEAFASFSNAVKILKCFQIRWWFLFHARKLEDFSWEMRENKVWGGEGEFVSVVMGCLMEFLWDFHNFFKFCETFKCLKIDFIIFLSHILLPLEWNKKSLQSNSSSLHDFWKELWNIFLLKEFVN